MNSDFRIGVFDVCRISSIKKPVDAIWETIDAVSRVEVLGYSRYWLGEHHTKDTAYSCPEILVPVLAGVTNRIRIGTTSLLRYRMPFRLASDFRLLETVFPNRIDLGIARGNVVPEVAKLLNESDPGVVYEDKVGELVGFLQGSGSIAAFPRGVAPPEIWMLGSARTSMILAAKYGMAFCLAHFLSARSAPPAANIVGEYRTRFSELSAGVLQPKWSIAVAGVCAETEDIARRLAANVVGFSPSMVGTPSQCRDLFDGLRAAYETNEFIFLDVCDRFEDRMQSYALLAEAMGLGDSRA